MFSDRPSGATETHDEEYTERHTLSDVNATSRNGSVTLVSPTVDEPSSRPYFIQDIVLATARPTVETLRKEPPCSEFRQERPEIRAAFAIRHPLAHSAICRVVHRSLSSLFLKPFFPKMPLARGNVSPMRGAHKATAMFRERQRLVRILARHQQNATQRECVELVERLQQEQQATSLDKRRTCDAVGQEYQESKAALTTKRMKTTELDDLKVSVQQVQCQVTVAARHIQDLRQLVQGLVQERQQLQQQVECPTLCA